MATRLNPYISFKNEARQAMEFYRDVFGGKLTSTTFKESHASTDPSEEDLVMHAMLETDNGLVLMASDTPNRMEYSPGNNVSLSLSGEDETELRGYWDKLSAAGTTPMPLQKAIWGDTFGMCIDRFGVNWLINISGGDPAQSSER